MHTHTSKGPKGIIRRMFCLFVCFVFWKGCTLSFKPRLQPHRSYTHTHTQHVRTHARTHARSHAFTHTHTTTTTTNNTHTHTHTHARTNTYPVPPTAPTHTQPTPPPPPTQHTHTRLITGYLSGVQGPPTAAGGRWEGDGGDTDPTGPPPRPRPRPPPPDCRLLEPQRSLCPHWWWCSTNSRSGWSGRNGRRRSKIRLRRHFVLHNYVFVAVFINYSLWYLSLFISLCLPWIPFVNT